jgi:hypothetical protein
VTPRSAAPCSVTPHSAAPCSAAPRSAAPRSAAPRFVTPHTVVPCYVLMFYIVPKKLPSLIETISNTEAIVAMLLIAVLYSPSKQSLVSGL